MPPKKPIRRLLVALASLAVALPLAEAGLRIGGFEHPPYQPRIVLWGGDKEAELHSGAGLHEDSGSQLWAPRPGALVPWGQPPDHVNARGYRGPELALERTPGVLRIATLGDSSSFGHSVRWSETYSARLVEQLAERGVQAEVLTGGVVGFTIRQGIERYRELVRPHRPDVVVAAFGAVNEHLRCIGLPDAEKIAVWRAHSSVWRERGRALAAELRLMHLAGWIADRFRPDRSERFAAHREQWRLQQASEEEVGASNWSGRRRVSPEEFRTALEELAAEVRADGARLVLVSMPRHPQKEERMPVLGAYTAALQDFARQTGTPLVDFRGLVGSARAPGRWPDLFADHYHPGPLGHALLAGRLAEVLEPPLRR